MNNSGVQLDMASIIKMTTRRVKNKSQTAESRLKGTGLLSKQRAFERSGVSWSTFTRALSVNFNGNRPLCGMARVPALRAIHFQTSARGRCVAIDPKDLRLWKQRRKGYIGNDPRNEKRSQSIPKIGDQARRRINESAR
jgi:hypothetical protein